MIGRTALAASFLIGASGCASTRPPAPPDPDFSCVLTHPSTSVGSLKQLPTPIRKALNDLVGEMADRGEFFNNGDVVTKPAPFARFIRGGQIGENWYVWHERGGIAYWLQITLFGSDPSGTAHVTAMAHIAQAGQLCTETDRLLDNLHR